MAVLYPNIHATLMRQTGYDQNGRATWNGATSIKVAIVTLRSSIERSSVRADSSASRGRAEEIRADGVVLVPETVTIDTQDRLSMLGKTYEVMSVFPRHGLDGFLGHNQVELRILSGN